MLTAIKIDVHYSLPRDDNGKGPDKQNDQVWPHISHPPVHQTHPIIRNYRETCLLLFTAPLQTGLLTIWNCVRGSSHTETSSPSGLPMIDLSAYISPSGWSCVDIIGCVSQRYVEFFDTRVRSSSHLHDFSLNLYGRHVNKHANGFGISPSRME